MKKLLAILIAAAMMFALTGCFGGSSNAIKDATSDEEAEAVKAADFEKDFEGLQDYLLTKGYIFSRDGNGDSLTTDIYYDIIGADNGIRYYFTDKKTFVEIYDYSTAKNDTAKSILEDIKEDGKFKAISGGDELTAVISKISKYVIAYNANNKYSYEKITDELENW